MHVFSENTNVALRVLQIKWVIKYTNEKSSLPSIDHHNVKCCIHSSRAGHVLILCKWYDKMSYKSIQASLSLFCNTLKNKWYTGASPEMELVSREGERSWILKDLESAHKTFHNNHGALTRNTDQQRRIQDRHIPPRRITPFQKAK